MHKLYVFSQNSWSSRNIRYTRDSTEGGPYRSEFWVIFFVIELHWVGGLRSEMFEIGPAVPEIWPFLDFSPKMRPKLVC